MSSGASNHEGTLLEGGRYQVQYLIGKGSFKSVWQVEDRLEQVPVALSVLHDAHNIPDVQELFWREANLLRRLTLDAPLGVKPYKQRVVEFLNFGELKDDPPFSGLYIVTRLVEGWPLSSLRRENRLPLPIPTAQSIVCDVLEALELSHTPTPHRGPILHRDIKPPNIILRPDGRAVVLDFGIAKLIETTQVEQSEVMGTLRYMAPEQLDANARIGPGTDLFAVGVILHELVTGELPWSRNRISEAISHLQAGMSGHPMPLVHLDKLSLPPRFEGALRTLLEFRIEDRPRSAQEARSLFSSKPSPKTMRLELEPSIELKTSLSSEVRLQPLGEEPLVEPMVPDSKLDPVPTIGGAKELFIGLMALVGSIAISSVYLLNDDSPATNVIVIPEAPSVDTLSPQDPQRKKTASKKLLTEGNSALLRGDYKSAEDKLLQCVKLLPRMAECHRSLGVLYAKTHRTTPSIEHYRAYIKYAPNAPDVLDVQKLIQQAEQNR